MIKRTLSPFFFSKKAEKVNEKWRKYHIIETHRFRRSTYEKTHVVTKIVFCFR